MIHNINYPQVIGTREDRGKAIAENDGQIKRIDDHAYKVKSQSRNKWYNVTSTEICWRRNCSNHETRGVKYKHIYAVEISFAIRKKVEVKKIEPIVITGCLFGNSSNIVKDEMLSDIPQFHKNS